MTPEFGSPLYPVLDAGKFGGGDPGPILRALAAAGVRIAQLRAKEMGPREFLAWARAGVRAARPAGLAVIVNDRVETALLAEADGVHLGQDDFSCRTARAALGDRAVIGLSTHGEDEARAADAEPCDYIAIGPVFETGSKPDARPTVGLSGVGRARRATARPLVAIGGIGPERIGRVLDAGADAAAALSAVAGNSPSEVEEAARALLRSAGRPRKERPAISSSTGGSGVPLRFSGGSPGRFIRRFFGWAPSPAAVR